jgi:hypothetical protein
MTDDRPQKITFGEMREMGVAALEDIDQARDSIEDGCEILRGIVAQE